MEYEEDPYKSNSVCLVQGLQFPIKIAEWILEESGDVLEGSPLLGHVSWFSSCHHKLGEVTISLLGKRSTV